ncbi:MAG: hypothetical protein OXG19_07665 [Chloroflexi bacterium]|nr:hypothetical protein [Chloroflexota bacterium]
MLRSRTGPKRSPGSGSLRQLRPGVWQARWSVGSGARHRYSSQMVYGTKTEAQALLRK